MADILFNNKIGFKFDQNFLNWNANDLSSCWIDNIPY